MSSIATVLGQGSVLLEKDLAEFRRWRTPGVPEEELPEPLPLLPKDRELTPEEHSEREGAVRTLKQDIERVFHDRDLVLVRVTDPDLLRQYLATRMRGTIHVRVGTEEADIEIDFGRTSHGEYVFPWSSEALEEAFERSDAWLIAPSEVYFTGINVYSYGDMKAFVVCVPSGSA